MSVQEDYRRGRHSVTRLVTHLVFTTNALLEYLPPELEQERRAVVEIVFRL